MSTYINTHFNTLSNGSFAAGIACGTAVGYTLGADGDLTMNALITTGCGVTRAVSTLLFQRSDIQELIANSNAQNEINPTAMNVRSFLYKANLGFSIGIAIGTGASSTTFLSGLLHGAVVQAVGLLAEVLPSTTLKKPIQINFDPNGKATLL